jgi:hypothetical protein
MNWNYVTHRTKITSHTDNRVVANVDAINTFGVSAGPVASFGVVSRRQIQCFRRSS